MARFGTRRRPPPGSSTSCCHPPQVNPVHRSPAHLPSNCVRRFAAADQLAATVVVVEPAPADDGVGLVELVVPAPAPPAIGASVPTTTMMCASFGSPTSAGGGVGNGCAALAGRTGVAGTPPPPPAGT